MSFVEGQRGVKEAVAKLRQVDEQLLAISRRVPVHLGGIIDCVRDDLLKDAVATLTAVSVKSAAELKADPPSETWYEAPERSPK
jgi:hypothetical protein